MYELFTQGTSVLETTPFDEFHIYFEDHTHFWIIRSLKDENVPALSNRQIPYKLTPPQITFYYADAKGKQISELEFTEEEISHESDDFDPFLEDEKEASVQVHGWFREIRKSIPVRFIETQRLLNLSSSSIVLSSSPVRFTETQRSINSAAITWRPVPARRPAMSPAITLYSKELSETLTAKIADSTTLTQELDRTFPRRLVELSTRQRDIAESELRDKLDELEAKRKSLMAVGLVDQNASDAVLAANSIDTSTKAVLSLYIEDTRQKLAAFDDIAPKIELFTRIINKRFLYKEMTVNRKDGFVFTTPRGTRLALENLSSGEQHELVLFYELLFKASLGSLIMIDEPEISLHVVWQEQFVRDVQDITRLAGVDVLIATHSPDIIDGHRALVVELEGPKDGGL